MSKKKSNFRKYKAGGFLVIAISLFCIGILVSTLSVNKIVEQKVEMEWYNLPPLGEGNPGAGAGGMIRQYVNALGHFTYTSNITINSSCYGVGQTNNSHINSTVPYGASGVHEFAWKVRFNVSQAWNSTSSAWDLTLIRGNITCAGHSVTDQAMEEYHIANSTTYVWVHYVWDNSNSGHTLTRGENITSVLGTFQYYG